MKYKVSDGPSLKLANRPMIQTHIIGNRPADYLRSLRFPIPDCDGHCR